MHVCIFPTFERPQPLNSNHRRHRRRRWRRLGRRAALAGHRGSIAQWREVRADRRLEAPRWPILSLHRASLTLSVETAIRRHTTHQALLHGSRFIFARAARHLVNLHKPHNGLVPWPDNLKCAGRTAQLASQQPRLLAKASSNTAHCLPEAQHLAMFDPMH